MSAPLNIQQNVSLKPFNTFGLNVMAREMVFIESLPQARELFVRSDLQQPRLILGGGSNVLFTKDFAGLVVINRLRGVEKINEDSSHVWLRVAAGENWHELVLYSLAHGLSGIENLSLIPGSVGAAPMQNIGAYGAELCDVFAELSAINLADGSLETFNKAQCEFDYRSSIFKHSHKNKYFITDVTLKLNKKPSLNTAYGAIQNKLAEKNINHPTPQDISDVVIEIRQSKLPDPKNIGNAGSFFKNPLVTEQQYARLHEKHGAVPHYPASNHIKIAAGWLIEQCGFKGEKQGNIGVHDKQALVLVNYGDGDGAAIWRLAQDIQKSVQEAFNITLEPEVNVVL